MIWVYLISLILLLFDFFILRHYGDKNGRLLKRWVVILGIIIFILPVANMILLGIYTLVSPLIYIEYNWIPIENNKWDKFINWLNKEI